jgi:hypothetical protein
MNFQTDDYHLTSASPLINAGALLADAASDFDGNPRPQGLGYDIGAFEFISKPGPPSAPRGIKFNP